MVMEVCSSFKVTGRQKVIFLIVTLGTAVAIGGVIAIIYIHKIPFLTKESGNVSSEFYLDSDGNDEKLSNSTKFRACAKTPKEFRYYGPEEHNHLMTYMKGYWKNNCTEVLQGTKFSKRTYPSISNGFVNTVLDCYNLHHNLIIRPDDIWIAILTQFSFYINANSEEFRKQFVSFQDKKNLSISIPEISFRSSSYDLYITKLTEVIDENLIDKEIKNWILPNFTTTTKDDIVTSGAIFMATMKNYFDYEANFACGIPWITLEGTVEDWQEILRRSEKLKSYKLEKWYNMLQPILKKFVETKQGNININFYQRNHTNPEGSGSRYISGWISAFCAFHSQGTWFGNRITEDEPWPKININLIPPGVVEANVKIIDHGEHYDSVLFAGHIGYEVQEDGTTLQPQTGWVLALKSSNS